MTAYDMDTTAKYRQDSFMREAEHDRLVREARKASASVGARFLTGGGAPTGGGFAAWAIEQADRRLRPATPRRAA